MGEIETLKGYFVEQIRSHGIDATYFRLNTSRLDTDIPSGNSIYGEDNLSHYTTSADMVILMNLRNDNAIFQKFFNTVGDGEAYIVKEQFIHDLFSQTLSTSLSAVTGSVTLTFTSAENSLSGYNYEYDVSVPNTLVGTVNFDYPKYHRDYFLGNYASNTTIVSNDAEVDGFTIPIVQYNAPWNKYIAAPLYFNWMPTSTFFVDTSTTANILDQSDFSNILAIQQLPDSALYYGYPKFGTINASGNIYMEDYDTSGFGVIGFATFPELNLSAITSATSGLSGTITVPFEGTFEFKDPLAVPVKSDGGWDLSPQVGDFFRIAYNPENPEEYEIKKVLDRNLTDNGILSQLMSKFLWKCEIARRHPSHETIVSTRQHEDIGSIPLLSTIIENNSNTIFDYATKNVSSKEVINTSEVYGGY